MLPRHKWKKFFTAILHALILVSVLGLFAVAVPGNPAAAQADENLPKLDLSGPVQVEVGQPIVITLRLQKANNLAGFETALLFDGNAAEFGGLDLRNIGLRNAGRDVSPVAVIELAGGAAFGVYTCPVADCVARPGSQGYTKQDRGVDGEVLLATITLIGNLAGTLEIKLDAAKFVDAAGNPIMVSIPTPSLLVQVGTRGKDLYPAPASMWGLTPEVVEQPEQEAESFDLTKDGLVSHADVMEVAIEWELARMNADPCGSSFDMIRDVNHDGCIDVADMQRVAAQYSLVDVKETAPSAPSLTFVVNTAGDGPDANIGNGICQTASGLCSLRAAIQEANAHIGPDTIHFNISGSGVKTINLNGQLPSLNDSSGPTTIDGYTQPGASPNTDAHISNAVIQVEIKGKGEDKFDGLSITSAGNSVRGLAFYQLRRSIWIRGSGATGNLITGTFIGTNAAGTYGASIYQLNAHGIHIEQGASTNQIGGSTPAERNVISGNARHGLGIWHLTSDGNVIINNLVGLSPNGTATLPNRFHGIDLNFGASSNLVQNNVSSGNDMNGIEISHTTDTSDNEVVGNFVGTDVTGNLAPSFSSNKGRGILVEDGASNNMITENVIGNNQMGGIEILNNYTLGNHIYNNRIGIGLNGSAIGNPRFGILVNGSQNVVGPGNIIAYNQNAGLKIEQADADRNTITENAIYNNGSLGIDLFPKNVTPNDPGDTDSGPNENLNFPVLTSATSQQVTGTACAGCTVEIFISDGLASGYGEGMQFVSSGVADSNGNFTINVSGVAVGNVVTSTATDTLGNTSEFSQNRLVTAN